MSPSIQMQRAKAAVKAMKILGFGQDVAKPVLKELLKVYGNNWEYIEAENYRLLADAILDSEESKGSEANQRNAAFTDEIMKPVKRPMHVEDPGPSQSTIDPEAYGETLLKKKKLVASGEDTLMNFNGEINESAEAQCSYTGSGASLLKNGMAGVGEMAPQHAINFGEPSPPVGNTIPRLTRRTLRLFHQRDERYSCDREENVVCYKEPKIEGTEVMQETAAVSASTIIDKPVDATNNDILTNSNVPIAFVTRNGIPSGIAAKQGEVGKVGFSGANASNGLTHSSNLQLAPNKGIGIDSFQVSAQKELSNVQDRPSTNVNIASSNMGKVKLSLSCIFDCQNFKMPSIESVFKIVEDRCLKSYKILHPNCSLMNLMKEICQSAADLAAESGVLEEDAVTLPHLKKSLKSPQSPCIHSSRMTRSSFNGSSNSVSLETRRTSMNGPQSSLNLDGESNGIHENCAPESTGNTGSQFLAVLPLNENAVIASSPRHDEHDIAKGEERMKISVFNEFNSERTPPFFHYIPCNAIYQNAHVNFSLAQKDDCCIDCFGNCLSASIPCACTRETGGESVYTLDGLLKKEFLNECISMNCFTDKRHFYCKNCPIGRFKGEAKLVSCKGHLVKKFIKECWSKCGCNKRCGNRVVQRGITHNLQVFYTANGKGWGLRTLEELPRGAFVCEYVGEVLTSSELYDRTVQESGSAKHTYTSVLDADWDSKEGLRDEEALCLDATFYGNVGRFVNHRCFDANLIDVPIQWETPDHHYYHLAYFTTRKVEALEELTWDYGIDFKDRAHPIKAFKCLCGSRFCRDSCRSKARMRELSSK